MAYLDTLEFDGSSYYIGNPLLWDEIPNTTQAYTFDQETNKLTTIVHTLNNVAVRTDTFTYGTNTITETRTLNTGEVLTIVTNLTTLETTITLS